MINKTEFSWPASVANDQQYLVADINEAVNVFDQNPQQILAMTDGWVEGPVAAILRGGTNAISVMKMLAQSGIREIKIFHLEEKITELEDIFLSTVASEANKLFDSANIYWRNDPSIFELIKNIGAEYQMLFLGAPLAKSEVLPFYQKIKRVYQGNISIVRGPISDEEFSSGDEIYKWVRERTFEWTDFSLPAVLRNFKKKLNLQIEVVLPTLNEAKTVGKVIETALEVKQAGIIDSITLIDSASVDDTVNIARSYGLPVYQHHEICPELGSYRGKGEAMFKSALISNADILAWVDTDIENITPGFFYGLLGPMLTNPEIKFVKGYFSRPVRVESCGIELGGGRVTEILARPWINTFMPELSGFIQPLAGTVAIYRELLTKMKIPTNYGIEIAMLIQAVEYSGLWSIGQINLGEVIHKSKDIMGLSEMSFQILQVLASLKNNYLSQQHNTLRRVFSASGHFEISNKRFTTHWREFA